MTRVSSWSVELVTDMPAIPAIPLAFLPPKKRMRLNDFDINTPPKGTSQTCAPMFGANFLGHPSNDLDLNFPPKDTSQNVAPMFGNNLGHPSGYHDPEINSHAGMQGTRHADNGLPSLDLNLMSPPHFTSLSSLVEASTQNDVCHNSTMQKNVTNENASSSISHENTAQSIKKENNEKTPFFDFFKDKI